MSRVNFSAEQYELFASSSVSAEPERFSLSVDKTVVERIVDLGRFKGITKLPYGAKGLPIVGDASAAFDKAWLMSTDRTKSIGNGPRVRVVDLFAGCGGLSIGVREAATALGGSLESVFACDTDTSALSVYCANLSPCQISSSPIEQILSPNWSSPLTRSEKRLRHDCGSVDLLIGGPPCQGHSDLNNHTRRTDPRNELYGTMARATKVLRPRHVIIENVLGVRHSTDGVAQRTVEYLKALGYRTLSISLNAATFGVAQNRRRHFTLAMDGSAEACERTLTSFQCRERSVVWAIEDLLSETGTDTDAFNSAATHSRTNQQRIDFLFEHDLFELPDSQRPDCHRLKPHSYNSVYGRIRPSVPAPTITSGFGSTGQGRFVHPFRRRTITPHEAARIQFFPDWFEFRGLGRRQLQKSIGNAVPPKLGYVIALSVLNAEGT